MSDSTEKKDKKNKTFDFFGGGSRGGQRKGAGQVNVVSWGDKVARGSSPLIHMHLPERVERVSLFFLLIWTNQRQQQSRKEEGDQRWKLLLRLSTTTIHSVIQVIRVIIIFNESIINLSVINKGHLQHYRHHLRYRKPKRKEQLYHRQRQHQQTRTKDQLRTVLQRGGKAVVVVTTAGVGGAAARTSPRNTTTKRIQGGEVTGSQ